MPRAGHCRTRRTAGVGRRTDVRPQPTPTRTRSRHPVAAQCRGRRRCTCAPECVTKSISSPECASVRPFCPTTGRRRRGYRRSVFAPRRAPLPADLHEKPWQSVAASCLQMMGSPCSGQYAEKIWDAFRASRALDSYCENDGPVIACAPDHLLDFSSAGNAVADACAATTRSRACPRDPPLPTP